MTRDGWCQWFERGYRRDGLRHASRLSGRRSPLRFLFVEEGMVSDSAGSQDRDGTDGEAGARGLTHIAPVQDSASGGVLQEIRVARAVSNSASRTARTVLPGASRCGSQRGRLVRVYRHGCLPRKRGGSADDVRRLAPYARQGLEALALRRTWPPCCSSRICRWR